jgi:hypothetical protein
VPNTICDYHLGRTDRLAFCINEPQLFGLRIPAWIPTRDKRPGAIFPEPGEKLHKAQRTERALATEPQNNFVVVGVASEYRVSFVEFCDSSSIRQNFERNLLSSPSGKFLGTGPA